MSEPFKFIELEDEIMLRRAVRKTYKHEGMIGIYKCLGELQQSIMIVSDVALEMLAEEKKKSNGL